MITGPLGATVSAGRGMPDRRAAAASDSGPASLERALDVIGASPQARRCVRQSIDATCRSCWPRLAWRSSRLTADRYPVELSFAADDPTLRWTAEVTGPEVDPAQRLSAAADRITEWDPASAGLVRAFAPALRSVQQSGPLRWGCWIGGRWAAGAAGWKLYVEVPRSAPHVARVLVRPVLAAAGWPGHQTATLRMIGWDLPADRLELYLRSEHLDTSHLISLLDLAAARHRLRDLLDLLAAAYRQPVGSRLPGRSHGITVSFDRASDTVTAISVCAFASAMFGVDARARAAILTLARDRRWDLDRYAAVSSPLAARMVLPTAHQMATITVTADGPIRFQIGLRPPSWAPS